VVRAPLSAPRVAASSAYLTVSEIFPLEIRVLVIAIFYAFGTLADGIGAPILFAWIIGNRLENRAVDRLPRRRRLDDLRRHRRSPHRRRRRAQVP
jgi:hypothetical protein